MTNASNLTRRTVLIASSLAAASAALPAPTLARQDDDPLAGTVVTPLSGGAPSDVPDRMLILMRVTMEPGVSIPPHSHPGPVALFVESGLFGTEFIEGQGSVTRAATGGTPAAPIEMAPGDDVSMEPGDHLFYDGAVHTMRNDGDEELVLLVSALFDPEQPGFMFQDVATPITSRGPLTQG